MEKEKGNDVLSDILERFGKYQIIQYILVCLPIIFVSMNSVNYVFIAGDVGYRCYIPECESSNPSYSVDWWPNSVTDRCKKPILNKSLLEDNVCANSSFLTEVETCTHWVYESNNTIVGEFDMACEPWKTNIIGMIRNIGMATSMLIVGWVADKIGRKPAFIVCAVGVLLGNFKTITTSYNIYITLEFLESLVSGGAYTSGMVLMIEIGGKKNRILAGVLFAYAIYMGEALFACIAMLVPYWKHLLYIMCCPSIVFLSYIFIIKESPRWQILNERTKKAKNTLKVIAKMNKIDVNLAVLDNLSEDQLKRTCSDESKSKREGYKDVFKSREMIKRILVASFCRFTVSFIYYGLIVNSVWLPGNKYTNFMLAAVMSFPGELISMYFMNKYGRKVPLFLGYMICAAACIMSGYVSDHYTEIKISLFLIGKLVVAACYTGIVTYTMELFPTSVRGSLLGFCTLASCAGTTLAPLSSILTRISPALTSVCFGFSAVVSSLLLILTPETKDLPLMDTIGQVQDYVKAAKEKRALKKQKNDTNISFELEYTTRF